MTGSFFAGVFQSDNHLGLFRQIGRLRGTDAWEKPMRMVTPDILKGFGVDSEGLSVISLREYFRFPADTAGVMWSTPAEIVRTIPAPDGILINVTPFGFEAATGEWAAIQKKYPVGSPKFCPLCQHSEGLMVIEPEDSPRYTLERGGIFAYCAHHRLNGAQPAERTREGKSSKERDSL